jgi:hypothetical protein
MKETMDGNGPPSDSPDLSTILSISEWIEVFATGRGLTRHQITTDDNEISA